jgi:hypothetical protein
MVANFKLQGTASLVGVALLTGLSGQYVGLDLSHLLFSFYHDVGAKISLSLDSNKLSGVRQGYP